jgi:hypothetical protein
MTTQETSSQSTKIITVSPDSKINEDIVKNLDDVFSFASPREYRDALIEMYHSYILHEHKSLPNYFFDLATRVQMLVEFMKDCEEESKLRFKI